MYYQIFYRKTVFKLKALINLKNS